MARENHHITLQMPSWNLQVLSKTLPTAKGQKQPQTSSQTTRTHPAWKQHIESTHYDDGSCSKPIPTFTTAGK